jgi:hypothetical protein
MCGLSHGTQELLSNLIFSADIAKTSGKTLGEPRTQILDGIRTVTHSSDSRPLLILIISKKDMYFRRIENLTLLPILTPLIRTVQLTQTYIHT